MVSVDGYTKDGADLRFGRFATTAALLATSTPLGTAGQTVNAGLYVYKIASPEAVDHDLTTEGGTKLYVEPVGGSVYAEAFGITRSVSTDVTALFQKAHARAAATGSKLVVAGTTGGIRLSGDITVTTPLEINCELVVGASGILRLGASTPYDTVSYADLGGLTEFSSRITGLPADARGRYLWIETTQILTERSDDSPDYFKRSAVFVQNSNGDITPSLDATFDPDPSAVVKLFHKQKRTSVKISAIRCTEASGISEFLVIFQRDNTDLEVGKLSSDGAQIRTLFSVLANGCSIKNTDLDGHNASGLGYGISIALSCNTLLENLTGTSGRHSLSGRHGANVTIRNSILDQVDTHWGNGYFIENCHISNILWAGKDLTVEYTSLRGPYAIGIRSDLLLATGTLRVKGVALGKNASRLVTLSSGITRESALWTTPRRAFDDVVIDDVDMSSSSALHIYSVIVTAAPASYFDFRPPASLSITNVRAWSSTDVLAVRMDGALLKTMDQPSEIHLERILSRTEKALILSDGASFLPGSPHALKIRIVDCGDMRTSVDGTMIESMEIVRCNVQMRAFRATTSRGGITLYGGQIRNSTSAAQGSPVTAFNVVLADDSSNTSWAARRGCLPALGVAASVAADYTNPAYYGV